MNSISTWRDAVFAAAFALFDLIEDAELLDDFERELLREITSFRILSSVINFSLILVRHLEMFTISRIKPLIRSVQCRIKHVGGLVQARSGGPVYKKTALNS